MLAARSEISMQTLAGRNISGMSFYLSVKRTKIDTLVIDTDLSVPSTFRGRVRALKMIAAGRFVANVLGIRSKAQVEPSVVGWIAVTMIHHVRRIISGDHLPDNSGNSPPSVIQPHVKTTAGLGVRPTSSLTCEPRIKGSTRSDGLKMHLRTSDPEKFSGLRVVTKALAKICLWWQDAVSHLVLAGDRLVRAARVFPAPLPPVHPNLSQGGFR